MSLPEETAPSSEPNAAPAVVTTVDLEQVTEDINTRGPVIRALLVEAGKPTAAVDYAMGLVDGTPYQRTAALWILEATQEKIDNPDEHKNDPIADMVEAKFTKEMENNEEFIDWWYSIDETNEDVSKVMFEFDNSFDDEDEEAGENPDDDGEGTEHDNEADEVEAPVFNFGTATGASVGQTLSFADAGAVDEGTPRLASRLQAKADGEGGDVGQDPTNYRERSRSPLDDGGARD